MEYIIIGFLIIIFFILFFIISRFEGKFARASKDASENADKLKDAVGYALNEFRRGQQEGLDGVRNKVDERLDTNQRRLDERLDNVQRRLDGNALALQNQLNNSLAALQASTEKRLDEMRAVVSEKLEKTLETRIYKSFEVVNAQLESVNKGLGEMKSVAESVGSLKKVLASPKSRGILGELQLGAIIEDILPSQMYEKEIPTKKGASERVEYAIKFPGAESGGYVYLPIDSKFPLEDYYRLLDGYDAGDAVMVDAARKSLYARIKAFAKDVKTKYVSPPETTNFGIIFLPTEGLYAEIVRDGVFFDGLRQDGVVVAGPSTMSAMLNSLQVGFRTLQIQKGAADIEKTLIAVKKEFETFENVLNKANQRIKQAGNEIDELVGTRTRQINKKLHNIQVYTGDTVHETLGVDPSN